MHQTQEKPLDDKPCTVAEYLRPAKTAELEPLEQELKRIHQDLNDMSDCVAGLFVFVLLIAVASLIAV